MKIILRGGNQNRAAHHSFCKAELPSAAHLWPPGPVIRNTPIKNIRVQRYHGDHVISLLVFHLFQLLLFVFVGAWAIEEFASTPLEFKNWFLKRDKVSIYFATFQQWQKKSAPSGEIELDLPF